MKLKMISLFCVLPVFLCFSGCVWWDFLLFPVLNDFLSSLREPEGATHMAQTWELFLGVVSSLLTGMDVFSNLFSEGCLLVGLYNFYSYMRRFFVQFISYCFKVFIFGFLFVCVVPIIWQVLGKMPAYIAQERPCHTVITHDSDCKRRFLCSLEMVSCDFRQYQACHLILVRVIILIMNLSKW